MNKGILWNVVTTILDQIENPFIVRRPNSPKKMRYHADWKEVHNNSLTIFHEKGHAGLLLQCTDCYNSHPVQVFISFHPGSDNVSERYLLVGSISTSHPPTTQLLTNHLHIAGPSGYDERYYTCYPTRASNFLITDQAAKKVFDRILTIAKDEDPDLKYSAFNYTCIHFVQEIYHLAELDGHHYFALHPEGYASDTLGTYQFFYDYFTNKTATQEQTEYHTLLTSPLWDLY